MLVGEIRDMETAENAIQASLTGHLVFSTLHTNDAPGAYTRLVDMGVEPFLVASTVEAVMAQRLVRTLCTKCREAYQPEARRFAQDFPWDEFEKRGKPLYRPPAAAPAGNSVLAAGRAFSSCASRPIACGNWPTTAPAAGKSSRPPCEDGMRTLREDAWLKVLAGLTTVDEVLRVTKGDVIAE